MEDAMELRFNVQTKIQKPIAEVFDAIYNPSKLSQYFATGGARGSLDEGATAYWQFADFPSDPIPVIVKRMEKNSAIVFEWEANEHDKQEIVREPSYNTTVEITFEALSENETLVKITESGWRENQGALAGSYLNCMGWTQMSASLKAFVEYGINLRKGYF